MPHPTALSWVGLNMKQSALYHCIRDLPLYSITYFNSHPYGMPPLYVQRPSLVYFQIHPSKAVTVARKVIVINRQVPRIP